MTSTHSSRRNMYVLKRTREGVLTLQPTHKTKWVALFFVILTPLIFGVGLHYDWPTRLRIGATLFPLFGAIAYGLIHFFTRHFGSYAFFNPSRDEVIIRRRTLMGEEETQQISIKSIAAVCLAFTQSVSTHFTEKRQDGPGFKEKGDSWDSYELALTIQDGEKITLTESGAKNNLEQMGTAIAKALRKPFEMTDKGR